MNQQPGSYQLFNRFIETNVGSGFKGIDPADPLTLELEEMMEHKNQFCYIGDLIQIQILWTSTRSNIMMGIEPETLNPYHFFEATHPDDISRLSLGRAHLLRMADELYKAEQGTALFSTDFSVRNAEGVYSRMLVQLYLFYTTTPYKTVFTLKVHTNIDAFKKSTIGHHYYSGNDLSNFRYPDEPLLMTGQMLSDRELDIIRLIEHGMRSDQIAEQLHISLHTVNTHRKNILHKTGKQTISDVIYALMESGVL